MTAGRTLTALDQVRERARRAIAVLAPGHAGALDESAIAVLA